MTTLAVGLKRYPGRRLAIDGDEKYRSATAISSEEKEFPRRGRCNFRATIRNSGYVPGRVRTSGYDPRVHYDGVRRQLPHDPSRGGRQRV